MSNDEHIINSLVSQTKHLTYKKINESIDLEKVATDLGVSFSKFRTDFKKQTGTSLIHYHLGWKKEKAKELLLRSN